MLQYSTIRPLGELGDERVLETLTTVYEESKTWEGEVVDGERPGRRFDLYGFQDALLWAIEKIRKRLGTTSAAEDTSGTSAAT